MAKKNIATLKTDIQIGDKPTAGRTTPIPKDSLKPKDEVKTDDNKKKEE